MSNEQVEQSSDGTQLNVGTQESQSVTFPTKVDDSPQIEAEKKAFKTYVESTGQPIPENFNDVDSWFSSLKEAQANYTRGQQEIADLKKQYGEQGLPETNIDPETVVNAAPEIPNITSNSPQLRIEEPIQEEASAVEASNIGVNQETYEAWGMEMAATGKISNETRAEIQNKTGFSDKMIDDFVSGQKARLRENFSKASNVVGGQEKLQHIFDWAGKNLSSEDQQMINIGLASPSYEVTLRGLSSMYDQAVTAQKNAEPVRNKNLASASGSEVGIRPYTSKSEFSKERNNIKFQQDTMYREMVESRMSITDWNTISQF
jgi:hypothetical protein